MTTNTQDSLEKVKQAMQDFSTQVSKESFMDAEHVSQHLNLDDPVKKSTISYEGPEGSFKITYDPQKGEATAKVDWITGKFTSRVTAAGCESKGDSPVYHPRWGILGKAFTEDEDM